MITQIELVNFMSHKHTVIRPAAGLTVLVGPNNCGKSAVVAALQILCENEPSTYVTRHGQRDCTVRIETDDGHTIEWGRKGNSTRYILDGQRFDRLGRGVPDEVRKALRLANVTWESGQLNVHFGAQKSPVFLLDKPGSQAAQFFASSSDASRLVEMQALHKRKLVDAQRDKARLEAESSQLNRELETLEPLTSVDARLEHAEAAHARLSELAAEIQTLDRDAEALDSQTSLLAKQNKIVAALSGLTAPPAIEPTAPLEDMIAAAEREARLFAHAQVRAVALATLAAPPEATPIEALEQLIRGIGDCERTLRDRQAELTAMTALAPPPALADTDYLSALVARLNAAATVLADDAQRELVLAQLAPPPPPIDEQALSGLCDALIAAHRAIDRCQERLSALEHLVEAPAMLDPTGLADCLATVALVERQAAEAEQHARLAAVELSVAADELRQWAAASGECPTCGAQLDADRLLAAVASGHAGACHG